MDEKSRVPWFALILAGVLAFVASMAASAATVMVYAFALAMRARGAPDPNKISAFANSVLPIAAPLMLSLLVLFAARIAVHRATAPQLWHGLMVGVVATLPTLIFMRRPGLVDAVALLLPLAGGLLGAVWARSRKAKET
jgi:hypothetical protein